MAIGISPFPADKSTQKTRGLFGLLVFTRRGIIFWMTIDMASENEVFERFKASVLGPVYRFDLQVMGAMDEVLFSTFFLWLSNFIDG